MKKNIITTLVFSIIITFAVAQISSTPINIILKNSAFLPKKIVVISYSPGDAGNGTQGCFLMPSATKKFSFKVGTKLYLANKNQVDTVMSGKRIDEGKPFLLVKKEDNNQVFKF